MVIPVQFVSFFIHFRANSCRKETSWWCRSSSCGIAVHQSLTQRSFTSCSFERRAQCVQHSDESLGASSSLPIPEWKVIVDHLIRIYHVHAKDSGVVQSLFVMLGNLTNQTSIRKIVFESEALVIGHEILRKRDMRGTINKSRYTTNHPILWRMCR